MKVEIKLDERYHEAKVIILTDSVTEEIRRLTAMISQDHPSILTGRKDERVEVIDPEELIRVFSSGGKVYAVTGRGEYRLNLRLYEMENLLDPRTFVRISNSEIVNVKKIQSFDLSITGTIGVRFLDGSSTYVSRRYVSRVKKNLGL
ncbi:MAG: LytTR family DNA-binding domain-containing protein [Anaerovoracaceae bacterium]|jgi:DNA-binding LytR/AlgR family response regulator